MRVPSGDPIVGGENVGSVTLATAHELRNRKRISENDSARISRASRNQLVITQSNAACEQRRRLDDAPRFAMAGTIYIDNAAGRALRRRAADVKASDVLYSSGGFFTGEAIEIAFRSADGSQYVIARGVARCDEASLIARSGLPPAWESTNSRIDPANDCIVVAANDVRLYWPAAAAP